MARVIIIVLDSVGIGALPDAHLFGDGGSNTVGHVLDAYPFKLPNLARLGLGNLLSHVRLPAAKIPAAHVLRLATSSPAKDTLSGHWEMMGYPLARPFVTYPRGFSKDVVAYIEKLSGRRVIGNRAASGTEIILELGPLQERSGALIVYTSADSVLQIAAHEAVVPLEELYRICEATLEYMLTIDQMVARVIARPFLGVYPKYWRTQHRRDFVMKPGFTLLNRLQEEGKCVIGIGKINDIFAGSGISKSYKTATNGEGIELTLAQIKGDKGDLIFTNLVDFDALYGHRNDCLGYGRALEEFDASLPLLLEALRDGDLLIITADHGCDPGFPGTDHTREFVPGLLFWPGLDRGSRLPDADSLCSIGKTTAQWLEIKPPACGENLLKGVQK